MTDILIVDDAPTIRRMLSLILEKKGFQVVTAVNGREALQRLSETRFDVLITDINMPEINGIELVTQLRADNAYQKLAIIMLTGSEDEIQKGAIENAGADALLKKPVSSWNLIDTITHIQNERSPSATTG
jgi:two-component system chemotaxis response regulator CheY